MIPQGPWTLDPILDPNFQNYPILGSTRWTSGLGRCCAVIVQNHGRSSDACGCRMMRPTTRRLESKTSKSWLGLPGRRVRLRYNALERSIRYASCGGCLWIFDFDPSSRRTDIRSLIPGFWVKLDIPKRLGGNKKRLACPLLNFTPNRIMQTARYIRLLALLKLGNVFPSEAIGRIV